MNLDIEKIKEALEFIGCHTAHPDLNPCPICEKVDEALAALEAYNPKALEAERDRYKAETDAYKRAAQCDAISIEAWKEDAFRYKADAERLAFAATHVSFALHLAIETTEYGEHTAMCLMIRDDLPRLRAALAAHEEGKK